MTCTASYRPHRLLPTLLLLAAAFPAGAVSVVVPGTANIFGAGHTGSAATPAPAGQGGGTAPPWIAVTGGASLSFSAITGSVAYGCTNCTTPGPDGQVLGSVSNVQSWNGISGIYADRRGPLVGVFVGAAEPADPAPARWHVESTTTLAVFTPLLNQTFFIGDGLTGTGSGALQQFVAPAGAQRLYFGVVDALASGGLPGGYGNNTGSYTVTVSAVPEPAPAALLALGGLVLGLRRASETRQRRQ